MSLDSVGIGSVVAAIGALGTAAFGLVDALKILPGGGISEAGYIFIQRTVQVFFGNETRKNSSGDAKRLFDTLHGNWVNGRPLTDQKAIAKSLIKLRLNAQTAARFAAATDVDAAILKNVGEKMSIGSRLDPGETNVLGRFDLALTAILDDGYQHADQRYRNVTKFAAMIIAILLAVSGGLTLTPLNYTDFLGSSDMALAVLAGLLATPVAPITKDLASALAAGVKVAQAIRK